MDHNSLSPQSRRTGKHLLRSYVYGKTYYMAPNIQVLISPRNVSSDSVQFKSFRQNWLQYGLIQPVRDDYDLERCIGFSTSLICSDLPKQKYWKRNGLSGTAWFWWYWCIGHLEMVQDAKGFS